MRASKELIERVWEKADEIRGRDPDVWRKDSEGNYIRHGSYGTVGEYGWEIDHKNPVSKGRYRQHSQSATATLGRESGKV